MSLVQMAYVQFANGKRNPTGRPAPIEGGPAWTNSDRFTIDAKADGAPGQELMRGPMLQALLEDRFKLKIRHEAREVPVYALTVGKGGAKLQTAQKDKCFAIDPDRPVARADRPRGLFPCGVFAPSSTKEGSYMYGTTLANFCAQVSVVLDRNVIDNTGIAGVFDIFVQVPSTEPSAGTPADAIPMVPTAAAGRDPASRGIGNDALYQAIYSAVQRVGLKLEAAKGPGEFLVIDHVEKASGN